VRVLCFIIHAFTYKFRKKKYTKKLKNSFLNIVIHFYYPFYIPICFDYVAVRGPKLVFNGGYAVILVISNSIATVMALASLHRSFVDTISYLSLVFCTFRFYLHSWIADDDGDEYRKRVSI
jgi:hypothetical protein